MKHFITQALRNTFVTLLILMSYELGQYTYSKYINSKEHIGDMAAPDLQVIENLPKFGTFSYNEKSNGGVVRILSMMGACSASVIDDNYIITAAHCVDDSFHFLAKERVYQVFNDKGNYTGVLAKPVFLYHSQDVALMRCNCTSFKYVKALFTTGIPKLKDGVTSVGYPAGQRTRAEAYIYYAGNYSFFYTFVGGGIFRGMSGGPMFNSDGFLIAVNSAVYDSYIIGGPIIGVLSLAGID